MCLGPTLLQGCGDRPEPPSARAVASVDIGGTLEQARALHREGRYRDQEGVTEPDYEIQNFWDLLEILRDKHDIAVPEVI